MSLLDRLFDTLGAVFAEPPAGHDPVDAIVEGLAPALREAARVHLPVILSACTEVRLSEQVAYVLATVEHEARFGQPRFSRSIALVEDHNPFQRSAGGWRARVHTNGKVVTAPTEGELELRYWDSAYGGRLGNRRGTADGADFRGRGYVQLTGRDNYRRLTEHLVAQGFSYELDGVSWGPDLDLVAHPTHVHRALPLAARVLVDGMMTGLFTGRALREFVREGHVDFEGARRVVNGTDRAAAIARIAQRHAEILR